MPDVKTEQDYETVALGGGLTPEIDYSALMTESPQPKTKKPKSSTGTSPKKTNFSILVQELARAGEKGVKPDWEEIGQKAGYASGRSAQVCFGNVRRKWDAVDGKEESPLKPKAAKVTKPKKGRKGKKAPAKDTDDSDE